MSATTGGWLASRLPRWPARDPYLLLLTFILPLGGVVLVASARVPVVLGGDSVFERVSVQQMVLAGVGVVLALALSAVNYRRYARIAPVAFLGVLIALVAVLFVEDATSLFAARRWFRVGDLTVQPSEFAKIAMVVMLAALAHHYGGRIRQLRVSIIYLGGVVALVVVPIVLEPDLGAAITIAFVGFVMIFAAGARVWHLLLGFAALVPVALVSLTQNAYQRERLLTFLSGDPDINRTGYQAAQAQIAWVRVASPVAGSAWARRSFGCQSRTRTRSLRFSARNSAWSEQDWCWCYFLRCSCAGFRSPPPPTTCLAECWPLAS